MKVILLNASKNCNLSKTSHNYHQLSKNNRKVLDLKDSEAAMGIMNSPPLQRSRYKEMESLKRRFWKDGQFLKIYEEFMPDMVE